MEEIKYNLTPEKQIGFLRDLMVDVDHRINTFDVKKDEWATTEERFTTWFKFNVLNKLADHSSIEFA